MELAVDLGGTNIKIGLFEKGEIKEVCSITSKSEEGILNALIRVEEQLKQKKYLKKDLEIVGIATPGIVDIKKNKVLSINKKYADAISFSFEDWCKSRFDCPLIMENDANAALLGEVGRGCAKKETDVVMITLGTGIGTSAMMDGKLVRGKHFQAGILGGHWIIDLFGKECSCGSKGCLETIAGSRELAKSIPKKEGFNKSLLAKETEINMKTIIENMKKEDYFAKKCFAEIMDYYTIGIRNLIYAYDPEVIILSGGIMEGKEFILPAIKERVSKLTWIEPEKIQFKVPKNPNISSLLGLSVRMEAAR